MEAYNANPHYRLILSGKQNVDNFTHYVLKGHPSLVKIMERDYFHKLDPY